MATYHWAGATDVGRARNENQDAVHPSGTGHGSRPAVVAVADGLGGYAGGAEASNLAIAAVSAAEPSDAPVELVEAAQLRIKQRILEAVEDDPAMLQMATTLTLAVLQPEGTVSLGHVGDSRAYIGDGSALIQVTDDHTVAMDKVRTGEVSLADARDHREWHVMSNWLGWEECRVESHDLAVEPGERLLLCSDGLSNMVSDERIAELLFSGPPKKAAVALIDAANDAGGSDNISVVVVEVAG
jgi:protein phosphatase